MVLKKVYSCIVFIVMMLFCSSNISATSLPQCNINDIENAKVINCSNRKLGNTSVFSKAKKAHTIILRNSALDQIPNSLLKLDNLQKLDLSYNNIRKVNFTDTNLKNLSELNLSNNQIEGTIKNINKLTNIKTLNISYNSLFYLDTSFSSLKNLSVLNISYNSINALPQLHSLKKLQSLDAKSNFISNVSELKNSYITKLNVEGNIIEEKKIKSFKATHYIYKQNKILHKEVYKKVIKDAIDLENALKNNMSLTNGKIPVGFKKYFIGNFKDNKGQKIDIKEYLSNDYKIVKKAGVITADILLKNYRDQTYNTGGSLVITLLQNNEGEDKIVIENKLEFIPNEILNEFNEINVNKIKSANDKDILNMIANGVSDNPNYNMDNHSFLAYFLRVAIMFVLVLPILIIIYLIKSGDKLSNEIRELSD